MIEYIKENITDIAVSLIVYKLFGFEIAVIVILAVIMADIATIMKTVCKEQFAKYLSKNTKGIDNE